MSTDQKAISRGLYLHVFKTCEKIFHVYTALVRLEQLGGKDLEHDFRVTICVYVAMSPEV